MQEKLYVNSVSSVNYVYRSIFQWTFASDQIFTAGQQNAWVKHLLARTEATPQPDVDGKTEVACILMYYFWR